MTMSVNYSIELFSNYYNYKIQYELLISYWLFLCALAAVLLAASWWGKMHPFFLFLKWVEEDASWARELFFD
jgi:hypothetical protein